MGCVIVNQQKLAAIVGSASAQNLFAQGGACIGRTFLLTAPNGRTLRVTMTGDGAAIDGMTRAQLRRLSRIEDETTEQEGD